MGPEEARRNFLLGKFLIESNRAYLCLNFTSPSLRQKRTSRGFSVMKKTKITPGAVWKKREAEIPRLGKWKFVVLVLERWHLLEKENWTKDTSVYTPLPPTRKERMGTLELVRWSRCCKLLSSSGRAEISFDMETHPEDAVRENPNHARLWPHWRLLNYGEK